MKKFLLLFPLLFMFSGAHGLGSTEDETLSNSNDVCSHVRLLFVESIKVRRLYPVSTMWTN